MSEPMVTEVRERFESGNGAASGGMGEVSCLDSRAWGLVRLCAARQSAAITNSAATHNTQDVKELPKVKIEGGGERKGTGGGLAGIQAKVEPTVIASGVGSASQGLRIPDSERTTTKYMTKYERARVLGTRALQISHGAPIVGVGEGGQTDPLEIAKIELREKKTPIIIRRFLPSGRYEDWGVDELIIS